MNIYRKITEVKTIKNTAITIGTFDGLHLGHQKILDNLKEKAGETSGRNFIVTFDPHPRTIVNRGIEVALLSTIEEKLEIFEKCGIENVLVVEFTKDFSQISYSAFIEKYLVFGIGLNNVVIGYDHKFGKDRSGDEEVLLKYGRKANFGVTVVPPFTIEDEIISSTKIRKTLDDGNVELSNNYLGRPYSLTGKVIPGEKRGRIIGFPTANIEVSNEFKLIPKNGVYLVSCLVDSQQYYGLMNIGVRPTFDKSEQVHLETHILDFSQDIYGMNFKVDFIRRIRDEQKFDSVDQLIHQINIDKDVAINFVTEITN